MKYSAWLPSILDHKQKQQHAHARTGMLVSSRFIRLRRYIEDELGAVLSGRPPAVLARARFAMCEKVSPMSLHIGLVRVSLGVEPMMDVLFDTSDSNRHLRPAAYVAYRAQVPALLEHWRDSTGEDIALGTLVRAW